MKILPAALIVAALTGCATRGTISELGHAEFASELPEGERLTLIEPKPLGQFHAYPAGAGEGDYRCETRMVVAPHKIEGEKIFFSLEGRPRADRKIAFLAAAVYPMTGKDVIPFKQDGIVPDRPAIARARANRVQALDLILLEVVVPQKEIGDANTLAVPLLVRFEDGWTTIIYNAVLVPAE